MTPKERIERAEHELALAKSALAALDKPRLRHGDVYVTGSFVAIVRRESDGKWTVTHKDGSRRTTDESEMLNHVKDFLYIFNLDDLKELGKELSKFKFEPNDKSHDAQPVTVKRVIIDNSLCVVFGDHDWWTHMNLAEAKDFSMKLRRVIITAEKEAKT